MSYPNIPLRKVLPNVEYTVCIGKLVSCPEKHSWSWNSPFASCMRPPQLFSDSPALLCIGSRRHFFSSNSLIRPAWHRSNHYTGAAAQPLRQVLNLGPAVKLMSSQRAV